MKFATFDKLIKFVYIFSSMHRSVQLTVWLYDLLSFAVSKNISFQSIYKLDVVWNPELQL